MTPVQLKITPLQMAHYRESMGALEDRYTNFMAGTDYPFRMISVTRRFSFAAQRSSFQRESDLDNRRTWRWPWLQNYRRMFDTLERLDPPLAIDHYLVAWPEAMMTPEVLRSTVRSAFLVPEVTESALPALIPGRYVEEARYLQPVDEGYPYLTVMLAWDLRGEWDLLSWSPLLLSDYELALAIDVTTLRRDQADTRASNAHAMLRESIYGKHSTKDARSERALAATNEVLSRLGDQSLHQISVAILLSAATLAQLEQQARSLKAALGARVRLDRVTGAQAEYAKLFTPQPATAIRAPLPRHDNLSHGVAVQVPWGVRKTARTKGVLWGYDQAEGMPILFDLWGVTGHENAHLMMVGKSGSGKTVSLLMLALRHAVGGSQVIFFDPVGKSRLLTAAVGDGARYYDVAQQAAINILDVVSTDLGRQRSAVERKLSMILGRREDGVGQVRLIPRILSNFEIGAIDLAIQDAAVYGASGAWLPDLIDAPAAQQPILHDLVAALEQVAQAEALPEADLLAREIRMVLTGSRGSIFNTATTLDWDFSADVTGYNFAGADPALLPLYYDHGFEALNRYIRRRPLDAKPVIAIIDEFFYMSTVRALLAEVALATKTWRNFRAAMWTADQNAATYLGTTGTPDEWGAFTANNALLKVFFRQEASEAETIGRAYHDHLTSEQVQAIKTADTGECVVMFGDEVHNLVIQLTDEEQRAFF